MGGVFLLHPNSNPGALPSCTDAVCISEYPDFFVQLSFCTAKKIFIISKMLMPLPNASSLPVLPAYCAEMGNSG